MPLSNAHEYPICHFTNLNVVVAAPKLQPEGEKPEPTKVLTLQCGKCGSVFTQYSPHDTSKPPSV